MGCFALGFLFHMQKDEGSSGKNKLFRLEISVLREPLIHPWYSPGKCKSDKINTFKRMTQQLQDLAIPGDL